LPFGDDAFDLVTSRHPASVWWEEIARVLRPGGAYLAQHVGPATARELYEFFLGPQPVGVHSRHPDRQSASARAAGLTIETMRMERLQMQFFDVGDVVYFLRKVIWTVPDFTIERYHDRLHELDAQIRRDGVFVTYSTPVLVEAHAPTEFLTSTSPSGRGSADRLCPGSRSATEPASHVTNVGRTASNCRHRRR
jgi:SAM-dependent methyltransferase